MVEETAGLMARKQKRKRKEPESHHPFKAALPIAKDLALVHHFQDTPPPPSSTTLRTKPLILGLSGAPNNQTIPSG